MMSLVQRKRTEFTISRDNMKNSQLIKRNNIAGGYTKVYPLAYIQGITDGVTASLSILESESGEYNYNDIVLPHLTSPDSSKHYTVEYSYTFGPKTRNGLVRRIQFENSNDRGDIGGTYLSGSSTTDIESKLPSTNGYIKLICDIYGAYNYWHLYVVKDYNSEVQS